MSLRKSTREREREQRRREKERERAERQRRREQDARDPAIAEARRKRRRGILYGMLGGAILIGMGAAAHLLQQLPYDEETLCPYSPLAHRSFVLIDRSDEVIGPARLKQLILAEANNLPIHGRLTIYEINSSSDTITDALFDLCNPGRGDQVSPLYRNPRRVEKRYQDQFKTPLDRLLRRLTTPMQPTRSPIVESIGELIRIGATGRDGPSPVTRLLIASDFLQNSALYGNHYRTGEKLKLAQAGKTLRLAVGKTNTSVEAVVMQRRSKLREQERAIEKFWKPAFSQAGVSAVWR